MTCFADLRRRVVHTRLGQAHLRHFVLDRVGDLAEPHQPDFAGFPIDLGPDIVFLAIFGARRLLDRLFHGFEHLVALDPLVASDGIGGLKELRAGCK